MHILDEFLSGLKLSYEIIVVDDGSPQSEHLDVSKLPKKVKYIVEEKNHGKGFAVRQGVLHAEGRCIVFTDADLPYHLSAISYAQKIISAGSAFIAGDRTHPYSNGRNLIQNHRAILSIGFNLFSNFLIPGVKDTQCGFKAFSFEVAKAVFSQTKVDRFAFDVEVLHCLSRAKIPILQIPVRLLNNDASTVRIFSDSINMVLDLFKIYFRALRKEYNYALITATWSQQYWLEQKTARKNQKKSRKGA